MVAAPRRVEIELDGELLVLPEGESLLGALDAARCEPAVPALCWHPSLGTDARCGTCVVDVREADAEEWSRQLACRAEVRPGLAVRTAGAEVEASRARALEALCAPHPLECPVCERSGACALQTLAASAPAAPAERAPAGREPRLPIRRMGEALVLDAERCVGCGLCVRFDAAHLGGAALGLREEEGEPARVAFVGEDPAKWSHAYGANLAELCPVGAIGVRGERLLRPWQLEPRESLCHACGRGCNTFVDRRLESGGAVAIGASALARVRARRNDDVNGHWICDLGRGAGPARRGRWPAPFARGAGGVVALPEQDAVSRAAALLLEGGRSERGGVALLVSAWASNEDVYAALRLGRALAAEPIAWAAEAGTGDAWLRHPQLRANAAGARLLSLDGVDSLSEALADGRVSALLAVGHDFAVDDLGLLPPLVLIDCEGSELDAAASVGLPALHPLERAGSYTNAWGRVQRQRPALPGPPGAREVGAWLAALGQRLELEGFRVGEPLADFDVASVSQCLAEDEPAFADCGFAGLGASGRPLAAAGLAAIAGWEAA